MFINQTSDEKKKKREKREAGEGYSAFSKWLHIYKSQEHQVN